VIPVSGEVYPVKLLAAVTRRLFTALAILFGVTLALVALFPSAQFVIPAVVIASGFIGGFVGLQRRLRELTEADLELLASSWVHTCLSPLVGGVLALLLYILFLSELVSGNLFPQFVADDPARAASDFSSVLAQHATNYKDYAKLVFWSFFSGFSERFVTDVISRFEGTAVREIATQPGTQIETRTAPEIGAAPDAGI
jgi:ammonia channel protein AmtB